MSYSGYDIEDAIILNRSSLDRGFARASAIRRNVTGLSRYKNSHFTDKLMPPPKVEPHQIGKVNPMKFKKFQALDEDGLVGVSMKMETGDVFINKYCPIPENVPMEDLNSYQPKYKQ
jgi:DNA-directed RNA polymerase III subunit RPC2